MVQQGGGSPTHLADVTCTIYGTGSYDGKAISLKTVEIGLSASGPWTDITPVSPVAASATPAGTSFTFEVEPELWSGVVSVYLLVTVTPAAMADIDDVGGVYVWNGNITPAIPASITVPASSSGTFTVSWSAVDGATGYTLQEGIEQLDLSIIWGSTVYTGSGTSTSLTKTPGYVYWYRVRSYNPVPNYSSYRTSANGCSTIQPAILLSPDLGWASASRMLDPTYNTMVTSVSLAEAPVTTDPDIGYIGPEYRVVTTASGRRALPASVVRALPGNEIPYKYKLNTESVIRHTVLKTSAGAIPDER